MTEKVHQTDGKHSVTQQRNGRQQTPTHSQSSEPRSLLPAATKAFPALSNTLQRLCALKNQSQFTAFALETWVATLSIFPTEHVNRAILQIALSADPFPDVGKIIAQCQRMRAEAKMASGEYSRSEADHAKPTASTVRAVAEALQLRIE